MGDRSVAVFDEAGRHATESSVMRAVALIRAANGDGLIGVGAGSVMMTARIAAILLAEERPVDELITQYDGVSEAISPRLDKPKLPIINVLTAPTNAQNRGGSAMKREGAGRRLEMFDPKTRPASLYWDSQALLTAPPALATSSGLMVFWWSFMTLGGVPDGNPLVQADRKQAFELALDALPRMADSDSRARIAMCAAAFLQNRDEDSGGAPFDSHWIFKVCYALGSGIFTLRDDIDPAPVYVCLTTPAILNFGERNLRELRFMCRSLNLAGDDGLENAGPTTLAGMVDEFFGRLGYKRRLRDFGITRDQLPAIRDFALRNFNADRKRQLRQDVALLDATLEAAW
jgi:alcohol dehydrogenase class IV